MTATLSANLDKGSGHSPLSNLMSMALTIFGDNNIDLADGSLAVMLLSMANTIVMEVNAHPYRTDMPPIEFYTHPEDIRAINDATMIYGIASLYAAQQMSSKAGGLVGQYLKLLNQQLWSELNGNTRIQVRPKDSGVSNPTNGLDEGG